MQSIAFSNQIGYSLPNKRFTKTIIDLIFKEEKVKYSNVSFIFCGDNYLLGLNQLYLNHDFYTDILTFSLHSPHQPVHGEIYISLDRVRENAQLNKIDFLPELHRVMIHGILHLCGFEDKTNHEKKRMTLKEDKYLKLFGST